VLEDEQHVRELTRGAPIAQLALELEGLPVRDETEVSDPQFRHCTKATLQVVDPEQRFWPARIRWRLRGAWMWPSFVAITIVDGVLLHALPPVRDGVDLIPGILIATFANLVLIGAVGPWLARRIWKRRPAAAPSAPAKAQFEVLSDRVGTGLLVAGVFGVLAAGLAARPLVVAETDERERAAEKLFQYVQAHGDDELRRNLEASDTIKYADGYFRSCIPDDERESWTCFVLDATGEEATIRRDPSAEPNEIDP
jgi:hypothetical protein